MIKISAGMAFALLVVFTAQAQTVPLKLERTITLPGVTGKFDHFAIDESGNRLFAAATGSNAVEVIDLKSGTIAQSLTGLGKPHGVAWVAGTGRLFVADGSKAELDVFEGVPLKLVKSIKLSEDADDMVADIATGLLYVGHGGTDAANPAAVAVVDTRTLTPVATLPVAAHPEALEIDPARDLIFVNISDTGEVIVIDGKTHAIAAKWALKSAKGNTPLAFDTADNRLLIGCRTPAKLLLLNGETGVELSAASSSTGADDLFYEPGTRRAYLITGSGVIDTYQLSAEGNLTPLERTETAPGAKTGLLVTTEKVLYVGIPGVGGPAQIRLYATGNN